jgi:AcrR family transcriptional regulator
MANTEPAPLDRRVRRTQRALKEAFLALVLENGYDKVSIEDITTRADVARATFYAHFPHKEALLNAVFAEMVADIAPRVMPDSTPSAVVLTGAVEEAYRHAAKLPDLYRVCLSGAAGGIAREAYLETVFKLSEATITGRLRALGSSPRVPVAVMARAFAGAHVALLRAWLAGGLDYPAEEMALMEMQAMQMGMGWAQGIPPEELSFARER